MVVVVVGGNPIWGSLIIAEVFIKLSEWDVWEDKALEI